MSRLYARHDWRLAAAGILAGMATLVVVLLLWYSTLGSGGTTVTTTMPQRDGTDPDAGPVIGRFSGGITKRLRDSRPSTTPLDGPLMVSIRDIEWLEPGGRTFARASGGTARLATGPLSEGDVFLNRVVLNDPEVFLREATPEDWNFVAVFDELLNAPETNEPKRIIHLDGLHIANGYVDIKRPADAFSIRTIEGDIDALTLSDPALSSPLMLLSSLDGIFERPSTKTRLPLHAETARITFPEGTASFEVAQVTIENTQLANVRGIWNPEWEGYALEAEGDAVAFNVADFRSFAPDRMPEDGTATFHFVVRPLAGDGTDIALTNVKFDGTGAKATGDVAFQYFPTRFQLGDVDLAVQALSLALVEKMSGRDIPYDGTISGTLRGPARDIRLDLLATVTTAQVDTPFATRITGSIALLEDGLTIRGLTAGLNAVPLSALRAFIPGIPFGGTVTGTVALNGSPSTTPMQLEMRLDVGAGIATITGMVDISGAIPRYDVTGSLAGIELQDVFEPAVPPVTVGARFALNGTGFAPDSIDARLRLDGDFSGWRANAGDTLLASVRIRNGTAEVDTLITTLATASLEASGQWRFVEPLAGAVAYHAAVTSLEPFGPYLPVIGDSIAAGSVEAEGTISGSLSNLTLAGTLEADEARSGGWSASTFAATYAVTLGQAVPEIQFDATGRGISTPTAGVYAVATATMRVTPPSFQVDIRAQRAQTDGAIEFVANGSIPASGTRELYVQQAFFDLREGRWQMTRPAHVSWGGDDGVRVDSLVLRNEATSGEVAVDGRVLPLDRADFSAHLAALPIGDIQQLLGREPIATGLVWADARIQPPGDAPLIDATFRLENGTLQGIPVTRLNGTLNYANERAVAHLTAALDTAGTLTVDAAVPIAISLVDSVTFNLLDEGPLSGQIIAQNFSLAPADSFITLVRDVAGVLNGTVTLGGTAGEPQLSGALALSSGMVVVPRLNQTYRDITGSLAFDGRRALLQNVSARSDGLAELTGDITFATLDEPVVNVRATMTGFRPLGVDNQDDAAVYGTVDLSGQLDELVMTGDVTLRDGYLIIPQFGADITTAYGDLTTASPVLGEDLAPANSAWITNLAVRNMTVRMGEGLWVAAAEARVQLEGVLNVNKSGDDIRIVGDLEGTRGTYTLAAGPIVRRFDITRALVRFLGESEMNPAISVDARRIVLDPGAKRLNVDVHIGGTMRAPTLSLTSADAPDIPDSELLSFLLFGRSTLALGDDPFASAGAAGLLGQTAFGGALETITGRIEQALVGDLGLPLDVFQVNLGLSGDASFVLGRQIADDLFASFESGIAELGNEATGGMNDWALRFDYAFAPQSSLQFGIEHVKRGGRIRGLSSLLGRDLRPQGFVELRRRWTY